MLAGGRSVRREHSHTAVRFLLKAFVGRHAQRHLAHLAAEATFVPILQRGEERARQQNEPPSTEIKKKTSCCQINFNSLFTADFVSSACK